MKFDFCIGNPPYQKMDGGAQASATPIYQYFSTEAKNISDISCLIQPARWMTGGKGLDDYRKEMINDKSIKLLYDYANSQDVFKGVDIKGGVCLYIRDNSYEGLCECHRFSVDGENISNRYLCENGDDIFIREPILVNIKNKVIKDNEKTLNSIVSTRKPYGLTADTMQNAKKYGLPEFDNIPSKNCYEILGLIDGRKRGWKYLPKNYPIPKINEGLMKYKVFIAEAYGCGEIGEIVSTPVVSTPVVSTPGQLCTETFLQIGPFETKYEAESLVKYIKTKFFRALVGIRKQTQHTTQKVYEYVPIQKFTEKSDIDWTKNISEIDEQLFLKYNLDETEKQFIKEKIKEME